MDDYVYRYVYEHGTKMERNLMTLWRVSKESGDNSDKFKDLEIFRQEMAEKYGLIPYEMEANMSVPGNKQINNNISINGSENVNISNSNNPKIINSNNTYNTYKYNIVYGNRDINAIVNLIPEKDNKIDYNYRDMLGAIHLKTRSVYHKFAGFVNKKQGERKLYLCNIFWNKKVYVCDHIVIFNKPDCVKKLNVGDYVEFIGEIESYTRKESNKEDIGLKMLEILNIVKPNLKVNIIPVSSKYYEPAPLSYLERLSNDQLESLYQEQISSIGFACTRFLTENYPIEVYIAMMQSVYYEVTREYDMIKDRLEIDVDKIDANFVKFSCFTKFLVCDNRILSPFVVYNILCCTIKRNPNKILNDKFYNNIKRCAEFNVKQMGIDISNILNNFSIYLSNVVTSVKTAIDHTYDENMF